MLIGAALGTLQAALAYLTLTALIIPLCPLEALTYDQRVQIELWVIRLKQVLIHLFSFFCEQQR